MTLIVNSEQLKIIYDYAKSIYPEECCGILLGKIANLTKTVVEVIPTSNDWDNSQSDSVSQRLKPPLVLQSLPTQTKFSTNIDPIESDGDNSTIDEDLVVRTKTSRYTIPPSAIFQAQKRGRDLELEIVGFFHSHPDYPAIPSMCDRDLAWDVYSYPIVSVIRGQVSDFKSWVLDRQGNFQPEEILCPTFRRGNS